MKTFEKSIHFIASNINKIKILSPFFIIHYWDVIIILVLYIGNTFNVS